MPLPSRCIYNQMLPAAEGSLAGLVGFPGIPPYSASKGGVIQLTKAAALEYAPKHIRCCAICPTGIMTPLVEHFIENSDNPEELRAQFTTMNPIPGAPEPVDVANAALYYRRSAACRRGLHREVALRGGSRSPARS